MRSLTLTLVALLAPFLAACQSGACDAGDPYMKLRLPMTFGSDPTMVDGPKRLRTVRVEEHELGVVGGAARCEPDARVSGYRVVGP